MALGLSALQMHTRADVILAINIDDVNGRKQLFVRGTPGSNLSVTANDS
jgi:hypothetical protein